MKIRHLPGKDSSLIRKLPKTRIFNAVVVKCRNKLSTIPILGTKISKHRYPT